eukprot:TRINITY_DN336_c1_g2_i1.p1 TRINITY_DN336_c1_g2~~TRINITY_DN336_c1_g2_i1.p1  ORF type:complete len:113 (+),score=23.85 TRINITY_DN336_c1_g2_i1:95-433(+)
MSKVPDFGWKFDPDNVGEYLVLSDDQRTVKKVDKGYHKIGVHSAAIVNYLLNKESDIRTWSIWCEKGIDKLAAGFGVIEKNKFVPFSSIYTDFIGVGTNNSYSSTTSLLNNS